MFRKFGLVLLLFLGGCASAGGSGIFTISRDLVTKDKMDAWVGRSKDELISVWGQPDKIEKADDGSEIVVYERHVPGDPSGPAGDWRYRFFMDENGKVSKWSQQDTTAENQGH
jgi:hypothetical protein